jgi:hypothetical protein
MTHPYEGPAERIPGESLDLDRLVSKAVQVSTKSRNMSEGKDIYLDSVAFNLHGFYSGLERIFEIIPVQKRFCPFAGAWGSLSK